MMIHNRYRAVGGEDQSTDAQIALLRSAGHDVTVVEDSNSRIAELGSLRTAARSIWSPEAHKRVEKLLAREEHDIVHGQNIFPLFSPSIYYAAARHGVPVVQSLRNFRRVCPEGMLHRDGHVCTDCVGKSFAWPAIAHKCYRGSAAGSGAVAIMSAGHQLARTWKNRVTRYTTSSEYAKRIFVAGGVAAEHIDVIPNFVFPDPGEAEGRGGYALYAGRLAATKGLGTLIAAWKDPEVNVPLKIVGAGPLDVEVRAAVASNPLIEYCGVVSKEEVSSLLADAMFAVVPTTGVETFGRVAAEAAARGTPAIVSDHGGLIEIVVDGETGLVFPRGNAAALSTRVKKLLGDPDLLGDMRIAARKRFLAKFSGESVLRAWVELYERVIAERSRA
jgi:glycosyltransferase involved in cell wall biosynthesis